MRFATILVSFTLGAFAVLAAADPVGPFGFSGRTYDPATPESWTIARDGTIESATQTSGDAEAGSIAVALWAGDNQAGGRGAGGINLFGPANQNAWIGLDKSWRIGEGVDGNGLWIYYTKFQQDALIVMGFVDCAAADLPTNHGAGFTLEGTQPWNRVLLVLPWRWVQGGGSAYQTGSYGNNPPEAGVWAVPAGMSLEDAAKQAGTYRLSGLDALLKEIQPHLWSSSYKLQLTAIGGWEVQVDIDNDGQVDHRTHGAAAGNLPNLFAGMDERSGLVVSSRGAMGNHSGTVGRTDYTLSYRMAPIKSGQGLNASFYNFDTNLHDIPDVSGLTPDVTRIDPVVNYPKTSGAWPGLPASMENTFASRHCGWLKVDTAGTHVLELESDDGSRLLLGDDVVVANDGLHGMKRRSGTRDLAATTHLILVDYFENGGQAGLILRWTPPGTATPAVIPSTNLFHGPSYSPTSVDRRPFTVSLHAQVKSSPTIIDGKSWGAGYKVAAASPTLGVDPVPTARISDRDFFIDLPLDPNAPTPVTFSQSGSPSPSTIFGEIEWLPVDMYHDEAITIRVGDSVKLQCFANCGDDVVKIDADGDDVIDFTGSQADAFVQHFDATGVYVVRAWNCVGEEIGTATITVTEFKWPEAIACGVGHTRTVTFHTGVHDPAGLVVDSNDNALMTVERGVAEGNHLRVTIQSHARGTPILEVRNPDGILLSSKVVDEFTVEISARRGIAVNDETSTGTVKVVMRPWIPGLDVVQTTFAGEATFAEANDDMSFSTNDFGCEFEGDEPVGTYRFDMTMAASADSYCFCQSWRQPNFEIVEVNKEGGINGGPCRLRVDTSVIPMKTSMTANSGVTTGFIRIKPTVHCNADTHLEDISLRKGVVSRTSNGSSGANGVVFDTIRHPQANGADFPNGYDCHGGDNVWQDFYVIPIEPGVYHVQVYETIFVKRLTIAHADIIGVPASMLLMVDNSTGMRAYWDTKYRLKVYPQTGTKGAAHIIDANAQYDINTNTATLEDTGGDFPSNVRLNPKTASVPAGQANMHYDLEIFGLRNTIPGIADPMLTARAQFAITDMMILTQTDFSAPDGTPASRATLGVGESFDLYFGKRMKKVRVTKNADESLIPDGHPDANIDKILNIPVGKESGRVQITAEDMQDNPVGPLVLTIIKPTGIIYSTYRTNAVHLAPPLWMDLPNGRLHSLG